MDFADGTLRLTVADRVATLLLAREAQRNALTRAVWAALPEAAAAIAADDGIRAVVLRGAGSLAFSAGADVRELPEIHASPASAEAFEAQLRAGIDAVAAIPVPVVAAVAGSCMGAGLALALAADLRLVDTTAQLALPPARLGLVYPFEDTARLVALVGPARALDLLATARILPAEEALRLGLVDRVLPEGGAFAAARAWALEVAALSPVSVRLAKRMVAEARAGAREPSPGLRAARKAAFAAPDLAEGLRALRERRPPRFG